LVTVLICAFTSCANSQNSTEIYSFSGENAFVAVNNGLIIITDKVEKFVGGDISFKGEELAGVKSSNAKFYYYKDGEEMIIQSNSDSMKSSGEGAGIKRDLGTSASQDLFYENNQEPVIDSLNFTLSGTFMTGETFEYRVPLEVEKIY
jgi:hypothetical protein